jgi:HEAT repeat protein
MAGSPIDRITAMLGSDAPDKQIAAAIVLRELGAKGPKIAKALAACLGSTSPPLQRQALESLARVGAARALPAILPLLQSRDADVRSAAMDAVASVGEAALPAVEARLAQADASERRMLDEVLARLGGKEAFGALLAALEDADEAAAHAAAVATRRQVREADARTKRSYQSQLEKVLAKQGKLAGAANVAVVRAALRMLGYLEDRRTVPILQRYAGDAKQPPSVRQEALIALRFAHGDGKPDAAMIQALVAAASAADRTLAQTALITLSAMELPARFAGKLDPLLSHSDLERARAVIDMLAHRPTEDAAELLVEVVAEREMRRARLAAEALRDRRDAVGPLVAALARCKESERARLLAGLLRPASAELTPAQRRKLRDEALDRLASGREGAKALLEVAREADPKGVADALRDLHAKLRRTKPARATLVLSELCKSDQATADDRFRLAFTLLGSGHKDTSNRDGDEALEQFEKLLRSGHDVVGALRRERGVELEALYYLGFHLIEQGHPAGEDLLRWVMDRGARKKIAKMARNKLQLAGHTA